MQTAFSEENGFELIFNAADNDAAAQIAAVRSFINQGVDAIVIAPIVEDGWEDVLQEASDAGIPVILEDRTVTASEDLYAAWVGLDFRREGVLAGEWAAAEFGDTPTRMVVLEGTTGSAPANDRAEGFDEAIAETAIEKIDSQTGDFTRDGGKTVMEGFLQNYGVDGIDLVYAHNDDMALGAIEAIEAAGGVPGEDIKIVSIDAVHDGMQALIDGKINFIVECNPLLGELAAGLVKDVLAGETVEKRTYVVDETFDQAKAEEVIDERLY
jgi:simple sugar transport system substrate-binding protein